MSRPGGGRILSNHQTVVKLVRHLLLLLLLLSIAIIDKRVWMVCGEKMTKFVVEDGSFGEDEKIPSKVLRNVETGEFVEILHSLGGKTERVRLWENRTGVLRDVLLTHRNATEARANRGWIGAQLVPFANRIRNGSYVLNGRHYFLERNEDRGVYGKNALHGYLYRHPMAVVEETGDDEEAALSLSYDFDGTDPGYPFLLGVNVRYVLSAAGLNITTTARNKMMNGQPVPFYNGWHSYFAVTDVSRASVELDRCGGWNHIKVTNDSNVYSDLIPTGFTEMWTDFNGKTAVGGSSERPTYYDDEFKSTASVAECPTLETRVRDAVSGSVSVLWQDAMYRFVQVYTGTVLALGENAIAIEAMSSEADAWNNGQGLRLLQSGEVFTGSFGVRVE